MQKKQKWSYFPKYYYEQSFIINYKSDYFDFESVYHDTMYMEENKMIACMFGWGYLDLDQEGSITEERNNSLIELAKRKKIIFVGKSNN